MKLNTWMGALALMASMGCAGPPTLEIVAPKVVHNDISGDRHHEEVIDGKPSKCHGGCSLKKHHVPPFTETDYLNTIDDYAAEPDPTVSSASLEKLLFYRELTLERLDTLGTGALSERHLAFLRRELSRAHVIVSMRMVDLADGAVHVALEPTAVPIAHKEHLHPQLLGNLQPFEMNGTPMRVGLGHIWARY